MPESIDPTLNVIALNEASAKRQDDLREMEARYLKEIMALRQEHTRELMKAESDRINALSEQARQQTALQTEQTRQTLDVIRNQIVELQKVQSTTTGGSTGKKDLWILIMGLVLFLISIAGFILNLVEH